MRACECVRECIYYLDFVPSVTNAVYYCMVKLIKATIIKKGNVRNAHQTQTQIMSQPQPMDLSIRQQTSVSLVPFGMEFIDFCLVEFFFFFHFI